VSERKLPTFLLKIAQSLESINDDDMFEIEILRSLRLAGRNPVKILHKVSNFRSFSQMFVPLAIKNLIINLF